jgi:MFS family permease
MNLGVMVPGMISGTISDLIGYKFFFVYVLLAAAPSFLVALMVPFRKITEDDPDEDPDRTSRKPAVLAPILLGIGLLLVVGTSTYLQFRGQ